MLTRDHHGMTTFITGCLRQICRAKMKTFVICFPIEICVASEELTKWSVLGFIVQSLKLMTLTCQGLFLKNSKGYENPTCSGIRL